MIRKSFQIFDFGEPLADGAALGRDGAIDIGAVRCAGAPRTSVKNPLLRRLARSARAHSMATRPIMRLRPIA
jgi:hypothetical protein